MPCEQAGCESKKVNYGYYADKIKLRCFGHKIVGMIDLSRNLCKECPIRASYGIPGGKPEYCSAHGAGKPGVENLTAKKCEKPGCKKFPAYNMPGITPGIYCFKHKDTGMVDVVAKGCEYPGCPVNNPCFNIRGMKTGRFCEQHKADGMVDVKHKPCENLACDKRANFGVAGTKTVKYCFKHKDPGMINIFGLKCAEAGCPLWPTYNLPNLKPKYCGTHKTDDMVAVGNSNLNCIVCHETRANFNTPGEKRPLYCKTCATSTMVDVKHNMCKDPGCTGSVRASYGLPGKPPTHCATHRKTGMLNSPNAKCQNCKEQAIYGDTALKPVRCETHKALGDLNLVERPCISCGLLYVLDANNRCETCDPTNFQRAHLAKQKALMDYLDTHGHPGTQTDIMIDGGACGRERPDRLFDYGDKIVIVECDENQHKDRSTECERTRMFNIGQALGGIPVYFIRWNPDGYKTGVSGRRGEAITKRYEYLVNMLAGIRAGTTILPTVGQQELVKCCYLFFDKFKKEDSVSWTSVSG